MKFTNGLIDRELSWLKFNERVLKLATEASSIPLMERVNFLSIANSNLAEFISVRFSYVVENLGRANRVDDIGNPDFKWKYQGILKSIFKFKESIYDVYDELVSSKKKSLRSIGVELVEDTKKLTKDDKKSMDRIFDSRIFPALSALMLDSTKEVPIFQDDEYHFMVSVKDKGANRLCFLSIPHQMERIVKLSKGKYVFLEDIISSNISKLFTGKMIEGMIEFKTNKFVHENLSSDSDKFIVDRMNRYLAARDYSNDNVFIDVRGDNQKLVKVLYKLLDIPKSHVFQTKKHIGLACLNQLNLKDYSETMKTSLYYPKFEPCTTTDVIGDGGIMEKLDKDDVLIQHPYESFDTVLDFVEEAATDPDVVSIKQTLYRISSSESRLIDSLCYASKLGKKVFILLEIKARFDERKNISLIEKLKSAGVTIIYGMELYKVHAKLCVVTKCTSNGIKMYSHVGTGNYNDKTARIYTDISYMTANPKIGKDLTKVFNMISGISEPKKLGVCSYSPVSLRKTLEKEIDEQIVRAKKKKSAFVFLKTNSLCDLRLMEKIKKAAKEGVKFEILCRGLCSLVADKNITIKSIVGRFLEHSRIYVFYKGNETSVYISSADLMTRNLDKRVELMIPVDDEQCKEKLLNIVEVFRKDTANTFEMNRKGSYEKLKGTVDSHKLFIKNSSENYKVPKKSLKK